MKKNVIILIAGLAVFVACAVVGVMIYVQNNKGFNKGVANLLLTRKASSSASGSSSILSNLNPKEQETVGDWSAVYTKTGQFETRFEENYYDDKTFRLEFRHIEREPIGHGVRGEVEIEIKFLGRGTWYCQGDRIYFDITSIPVLHVNNIKIDAPDIANTKGTGFIENVRQACVNDIQKAVTSRKAWLMKQKWYFDIVSSDGTTTVCRDRTGETLYRYKVIKPEKPAPASTAPGTGTTTTTTATTP